MAPIATVPQVGIEARNEAYILTTPLFPSDQEPHVSSHPEPNNFLFVLFLRIMFDQEHVILFQNSVGIFHSTRMSLTRFYPFENLTKV